MSIEQWTTTKEQYAHDYIYIYIYHNALIIIDYSIRINKLCIQYALRNNHKTNHMKRLKKINKQTLLTKKIDAWIDGLATKNWRTILVFKFVFGNS